MFSAHEGETPTITGSVIAIFLSATQWIKIDGIRAFDVDRFLLIQNGSHYNEIRNCVFDGARVDGVKIWNYAGGSSYDRPSTNNWIHHCTIRGRGLVNPSTCNDEGSLMKVGTHGLDTTSNNNTIEQNVVYHGGHHVLETYTMFNVIRDNVFHNEGWMEDPGGCERSSDSNGKYGNRNIQIYDGADRAGVFNLIEGNRFGHAGLPPDDNGAHNLVITSAKNIVRYNLSFAASGDGIYLKQGAGADSDDNRIYNNTVYLNGLAPPSRTDLQGRRNGITVHSQSTGNVVVNNLFFGNDAGLDVRCLLGGDCSLNTFLSNWSSHLADPEFVNPDITDPFSTMLPDLSLRSNSPVIDKGIHLTVTSNSASQSTTLIVQDALFFQDGSWGASISDVKADWISVGSVDEHIEIASIDYGTNTITLMTPASWNAGNRVWLNRRSGKIVVRGNAPDLGAVEFDPQTPSAPTGLRVVGTR